MEETPRTATVMKGLRIKGPPYSLEVVEDYVALETPVNIYINDRHAVTLFATPYELKELAVGHLVGEGMVKSLKEIEDITIDGSDILVYLRKGDEEVRRILEVHQNSRFILSSCGSVDDFIRILDRMEKPRVDSGFRISAERLHSLITEFGRGAKSFKHAVSVHTAAIYDGERDGIVAFVEDVSRHVTVDRAVGRIMLDGINPSCAIIMTTGRQASDMVLKAARIGVPITVSLRGPLFSGVYAAIKTGVTMISTVRGKGLTIYSHPERIIIDHQKREEGL